MAFYHEIICMISFNMMMYHVLVPMTQLLIISVLMSNLIVLFLRCSWRQELAMAAMGAVDTLCCRDACMHKTPILPAYCINFNSSFFKLLSASLLHIYIQRPKCVLTIHSDVLAPNTYHQQAQIYLYNWMHFHGFVVYQFLLCNFGNLV